MNRRALTRWLTTLILSCGALAPSAQAFNNQDVPLDSKDHFVSWMKEQRHEDEKFLGQRWDRLQAMKTNQDVADDRLARAFLSVPREEFVRKINRSHTYDHSFLDIGFGVTISGPHIVGRMTGSLNIQPGEKVLEVGTGSGYQSAVLSNLTDKVWTIEIIKPLQERTNGIYEGLQARSYSEYANIHRKNADGYYGWEDAGPFDKIIVTCGVDHVPPPLLQQLKTGGTMVIPVGPPGAQHVLKVTKEADAEGNIKVTRSDIYNGKVVPFVPFTKLEGEDIKGTHNQ